MGHDKENVVSKGGNGETWYLHMHTPIKWMAEGNMETRGFMQKLGELAKRVLELHNWKKVGQVCSPSSPKRIRLGFEKKRIKKKHWRFKEEEMGTQMEKRSRKSLEKNKFVVGVQRPFWEKHNWLGFSYTSWSPPPMQPNCGWVAQLDSVLGGVLGAAEDGEWWEGSC